MSDVTTELAKEASDKAMEIARLKAENDRLREPADFEHFQLGEMKRAAGMMLDEFVALENRNARLSELARRLRELVRGLLTGYECGRGELCDGCTWTGMEDPHEFRCPARVKARELGVEVDG